MDVDESHQTSRDLIVYFATSLEHFAWPGHRVLEVKERRRAMSNEFFYDILLRLGGVEEPAELYPPSNAAELGRLLLTIENMPFDSMKRQCLVYYLLKWHMDGREKGYASDKAISPHYVALSDAYWHLDSGIELEKAVSLLSDARIVKEFSSKVIATLSLAPIPAPLVLKYVRTCSPTLKDHQDLEKYVHALSHHSIVEAWLYQRQYPENDKTREFLIHQVLVWALKPIPRQQPLAQLLSVPMSNYEEDVVREFAIHPPTTLTAASTSVIRDLLCVRLIQSCKYIEAVKSDRQYPSSTNVAGATAKGTWASERKRIINDVLSIMPAAERALLDRELEGIAASSSRSTGVSGPGNGGSWTNLNSSSHSDLSMSWEDIGARPPRTNVRKEPAGPSVARPPAAASTRRTPLVNGLPATTVTDANLSARRTLGRTQPLSNHPTNLSQASTIPISSPNNSMLFASTSLNTLAPAQHIPLRAPVHPYASTSTANVSAPTINGTSSATPKTNAFMARNAFFQPPKDSTPTPQNLNLNGLDHTLTSPQPGRRTQPVRHEPDIVPAREKYNTQPAARVEEESTLEREVTLDGDQSTRIVEELLGGVESEREDIGFSIFGSAATATRKPLPSAIAPSPRKPKRTKSLVEDSGVPPGAFVEDEPVIHVTRLSTRASTAKAQVSPIKRSVSSTKRTSRKRAASPDDSFTRIPGALFDENDFHEHDHEEHEEEEEEDVVAPLPSQTQAQTRTRAKRSSNTHATTRKSRRSGSLASRSSVSTNTHESDAESISGQPVRRSSRLSVASSSPTEKKDKRSGAMGVTSTPARPRKSTRTAGAGATATGRGAAKRR